MIPAGRTDLETNPRPGFEPLGELSPEADGQLREALKRCSPCTYYAAYQFRRTGDARRLPVIVVGVIERFVSAELRGKLKEPADRLRLAEDLAIDSLTWMEIVLLLEDVLQISIATDELRALRTLGEAQRWLATKVRGLPGQGGPPTSGQAPPAASSCHADQA
jgi:3-hydroxyacyl-[acyl-carrier-protein] dehydratase